MPITPPPTITIERGIAGSPNTLVGGEDVDAVERHLRRPRRHAADGDDERVGGDRLGGGLADHLDGVRIGEPGAAVHDFDLVLGELLLDDLRLGLDDLVVVGPELLQGRGAAGGEEVLQARHRAADAADP